MRSTCIRVLPGVLAASLGGAAAGQSLPEPIIIDGVFNDWSGVPTAAVDPPGDAPQGSIDLLSLKIADDERFLYLLLETDREFDLREGPDLRLYLDTDADKGTGVERGAIGYDLSFRFNDAQGQGHGREPFVFAHDRAGVRAQPTVTSSIFEIAIARRFQNPVSPLPGQDPKGAALFESGRVRLAIADPSGDEIATVEHVFGGRPTRALRPLPLERRRPGDLRLSSFNVLRDSPWGRGQEPRFGRQLRAVSPDILCFQEIYDRGAGNVAELVGRWVEAPDGASWSAVRVNDNHLVTWLPILDSWAIGGNLAALVDTTEAFGAPSLIVNAHLFCCGNDAGRQEEVDQIIAFIRDARTPDAGVVDLPPGAPVFFVGDMNFVGLSRQVRTLVEGDIDRNDLWGPDFPADADGSALTDMFPRQTHAPMGYTWRSDGGGFWPGKLDYLIYSDAALLASPATALYTPNMPEDVLAAAGLEEGDSRASDHLLIFADFRPRGPRLADLSGDGVVNMLDVSGVLSSWGLSGVDADLNADGVVNGLDLGVVLASFGATIGD